METSTHFKYFLKLFVQAKYFLNDLMSLLALAKKGNQSGCIRTCKISLIYLHRKYIVCDSGSKEMLADNW